MRAKSLLSRGATRSMCSRKKSRVMSSSPGVLPRERLLMATAMFSGSMRLAVCSPSRTSCDSNPAVADCRRARTPALSRSACSVGEWTLLRRFFQKAATLASMACWSVCTCPGVTAVASRSWTRPLEVTAVAAWTVQVDGSSTLVMGWCGSQGLAALPWPVAAIWASWTAWASRSLRSLWFWCWSLACCRRSAWRERDRAASFCVRAILSCRRRMCFRVAALRLARSLACALWCARPISRTWDHRASAESGSGLGSLASRRRMAALTSGWRRVAGLRVPLGWGLGMGVPRRVIWTAS